MSNDTIPRCVAIIMMTAVLLFFDVPLTVVILMWGNWVAASSLADWDNPWPIFGLSFYSIEVIALIAYISMN